MIKKEKELRINEDGPRAIHMPEVDIRDLAKEYYKEI